MGQNMKKRTSKSVELEQGKAGHKIARCQVPNGRPKWGIGMPKNGKPKYSWIAKTNSDGNSNFFLILCPGMGGVTLYILWWV